MPDGGWNQTSTSGDGDGLNPGRRLRTGVPMTSNVLPLDGKGDDDDMAWRREDERD